MKISLSLLLGLIALPSFAQETSSEGVLVTGSRIPFESVGPVSLSGSPIDSVGHGCAEPDCGQGPEDPSGGLYTNVAAKKARNNRTKQKVSNKPVPTRQIVKNSKAQDTTEKSILDRGFDWLEKLNVTVTHKSSEESSTGKILPRETCVYIKAGEDKKNPCVTRSIDVEKVQKANGTVQNELRFTIDIYEACYYEKTCGVTSLEYIAESGAELRRLLNESIGENYF